MKSDITSLDSLLCGDPQGLVLGPMKFVCICFHLVRYLDTIILIGYHIYADDNQLYISFKCHDPLESLTKLNMCISDIRVWMIKNKLKINDSKTEFIIFRSPRLKQNLSDLSVSVGDMQVSPSSRVRDLGVVFDQYLTFHDHISGICLLRQLVKRVLIHSLIDLLCMLLQYSILWNALDLDIRLLPFDDFKNRVKTHLYLKYFYCICIICMIFLFLQCVSTVIIVYIIISPLNSYTYIHWLLRL